MSWKSTKALGGHGMVSGLIVVLDQRSCPCHESHRVPEAVHMPSRNLSVASLLKDDLEAGTLAASTPPFGRTAGSARADACRQAAI